MADAPKPSPRFNPAPALSRERVAVRRRFLQGGLATGPVLMTLVSRPVLGAVQCVTPSAFVSANASVAGVAAVCEGHTPDYWADAPSWPPPFTPDTPFNDVFGRDPEYPCDTLLDVVSPPDTGPAEQPAPPAADHGRKRKHDRLHTPKARDEPSRDSKGHGSFKRINYEMPDDGPRGHGSFSPIKYKVHDDLDTGLPSQKLGHKRKGKQHGPPPSPGPEPEAPPPPATIEPLGCNDNTPSAPESTPEPSSPAPAASGKRKRRSNDRGPRIPRQQDHVARHIVAALLNAQAGLTPAVSVRTVKGIWNEYRSNGYFEPTAGVRWSSDDILTYLASTQLL
jgi:hypothetical protein